MIRINCDAIEDVLDDACNDDYDIKTSHLRVTEQSIDESTGEHVIKLEYRFRSRDDDLYRDERFLSEGRSIVQAQVHRARMLLALLGDGGISAQPSPQVASNT